jgi:hypothetical protein
VIIGAKRPDQLADTIASTEIKLSAAELEQIGKVSGLPPEYPGRMFEMQGKYRRTQLDEALAAQRK